MKKVLTFGLLFALFFAFGCKEETTKPKEKVSEFETLTNYLESQPAESGQWINSSMSGWIVNYSGLNLSNYFLLDFRKADDFNKYHFEGAVNTTLSGMFEAVKSATKPVLCICYSGQTASYAHTLLRMKGIEAYVLKFGMSIVADSLDHWTGNCSNAYADNANWVKTASAALPKYDFPVLNTGKTKAEDILDARIEAAVAAWSTRLIAASSVVPTPENYNIMCYWTQTPWDTYGHIKGAYRLEPHTLTVSENLSAFDPAGNNVIYCYTGQTAAATIPYLEVLGYDVKSIKFGANAMIWDVLKDHKWPKPYGG